MKREMKVRAFFNRKKKTVAALSFLVRSEFSLFLRSTSFCYSQKKTLMILSSPPRLSLFLFFQISYNRRSSSILRSFFR